MRHGVIQFFLRPGVWTGFAWGVAGLATESRAGEFVSAVTNYNEGTFATVTGAQYNDLTDATLGQPNPIVGAGSGFPGILTPFESHYEQTDLLAFGLGGNLTMQFAQPMAVTGTPQIGVFTSAAFVDDDYPNGSTGTATQTDSMNEFGRRRTCDRRGGIPHGSVSIARSIHVR